jgi:hypothetical protein
MFNSKWCRASLTFFIIGTSLILSSCSSQLTSERKSQGYSIEWAGDRGRWGNYCTAILGSGGYCVADVVVTNNSEKMIAPSLRAELVDINGRVFSASDHSRESTLTGAFRSELNPSEALEWAINFNTGENVQFELLNIYEGTEKVATFTYSCSSNISAPTC